MTLRQLVSRREKEW